MLFRSAFTTPFLHIVYIVPIKPTMVIALLPVFYSNLVVEYIAIVTHSGVQLSTSFGPLSGKTEKVYDRLWEPLTLPETQLI